MSNISILKSAILFSVIGNRHFLGIVKAGNWFSKVSAPVLKDDFVVCEWFEFNDGVKSNVMGKITIAICREKEHARLIFDTINSERNPQNKKSKK